MHVSPPLLLLSCLLILKYNVRCSYAQWSPAICAANCWAKCAVNDGKDCKRTCQVETSCPQLKSVNINAIDGRKINLAARWHRGKVRLNWTTAAKSAHAASVIQSASSLSEDWTTFEDFFLGNTALLSQPSSNACKRWKYRAASVTSEGISSFSKPVILDPPKLHWTNPRFSVRRTSRNKDGTYSAIFRYQLPSDWYHGDVEIRPSVLPITCPAGHLEVSRGPGIFDINLRSRSAECVVKIGIDEYREPCASFFSKISTSHMMLFSFRDCLKNGCKALPCRKQIDCHLNYTIPLQECSQPTRVKVSWRETGHQSCIVREYRMKFAHVENGKLLKSIFVKQSSLNASYTFQIPPVYDSKSMVWNLSGCAIFTGVANVSSESLANLIEKEALLPSQLKLEKKVCSSKQKSNLTNILVLAIPLCFASLAITAIVCWLYWRTKRTRLPMKSKALAEANNSLEGKNSTNNLQMDL